MEQHRCSSAEAARTQLGSVRRHAPLRRPSRLTTRAAEPSRRGRDRSAWTSSDGRVRRPEAGAHMLLVKTDGFEQLLS
eukprot:2470650-Alexandrium_andersonii.AAC.1